MVRIAIAVLLCLPGILSAQELTEISRIEGRLQQPGVIMLRSPQSHSHALGMMNVTGFGVSGRVYLSLGLRKDLTTELSFGLMKIAPRLISDAYVNGVIYSQGFFLLPAYIGLRYDLLEHRTRDIVWSWYVRGGGGPAIGMLTPLGMDITSTLAYSSFHWGLGAYAATGLEVLIDGSLILFLQGGADYVGFVREVGDQGMFVGPSFSVGIGKLIP